MKLFRLLFFLGLSVFGSATIVAAELRLMMVEEDTCPWCAQWHEEIGPIYPKTQEGKIAPLVRQDIYTILPQGVTTTQGLHFTPTFILLRDGQEIDRIEGYPGEDFFWSLLNMMLQRASEDEGNS